MLSCGNLKQRRKTIVPIVKHKQPHCSLEQEVKTIIAALIYLQSNQPSPMIPDKIDFDQIYSHRNFDNWQVSWVFQKEIDVVRVLES
jgi:hypothetical protein